MNLKICEIIPPSQDYFTAYISESSHYQRRTTRGDRQGSIVFQKFKLQCQGGLIFCIVRLLYLLIQ